MKIPVLGDAVPKRGNRFSQAIGKMIFRAMGWHIEGEVPNLPKFVAIGAPHTTNWDFVVGMAALLTLGIHVHWLGKDSIFKWPVKYLWHWLGGEPVDRVNPHGVVEQTIDMFNGHERFVLALSPEGTRKTIPKWRMGFYHIAKGAKVPLLLVAFDFEHNSLNLGPLFFPTGNLAADMKTILAHYANVKGKYPKQLPIEQKV
jgi:1-acyl-sn-glycerol-3-phosphate acyltransferase